MSGADKGMFHVKHEIAEQALALDSRFGIDEAIAARLETFAAHLEKWQKAINLVGPKTLPQLWRRHILDSLQLVPLIPQGARTIVDVGSGAGFPGLILALLDRWDVHLVESDTRKSVFLRDSARLCGATATVHAKRIESLSEPKADVLTARALAPVAELLALTEGLRTPETLCLFPKGRSARAELTEAEKTWTLAAETVPSLTDAEAVVVKISEVVRK